MIAVDTSVLVYAHREDSPWHAPAHQCLGGLARSRWAIPWPSLHEFFAIVTHPRIFGPPSTGTEALKAIRSWTRLPTLELLTETAAHLETLEQRLMSSRVVGPKVRDARVAALCLQHGVVELWTADRDFSRLPDLRTRNPRA